MRDHGPRPASQAGRFYTSDPDALREEIESLLTAAPLEPHPAPPLGFVAPHAGYLYSGATAARVYRQLAKLDPETVFVLAPSHHALFPDASIWDGPSYKTPLGAQLIDLETVRRVREALPGVGCEETAERSEHALEVQIPFLQVACPRASLVPMLIGDQELPNIQKLARGVVEALEGQKEPRGRVAFVASSDGYHGDSLEQCLASDHALYEAIATMDVQRFHAAIHDRKAMACGHGPIALAMLLSKHYGAKRAVELGAATSADAMPRSSRDYVVGYRAIMFL